MRETISCEFDLMTGDKCCLNSEFSTWNNKVFDEKRKFEKDLIDFILLNDTLLFFNVSVELKNGDLLIIFKDKEEIEIFILMKVYKISPPLDRIAKQLLF